MAKPALRQRVHAVRAGSGLQHVGHQHRIVKAGDFDAVTLHQEVVVFEVLRHLEDGGILQQRLQPFQRLAERDLVFHQPASQQVALSGLVGNRHIAGPDRNARRIRTVIGDCQREADEFGQHGIERGGFRIEGDEAGLTRQRDPAIERIEIAHGLIAFRIDLHALEGFGPGRRKGGRRQRAGSGHRRGFRGCFNPGGGGCGGSATFTDIRPVCVSAPFGCHLNRFNGSGVRARRLSHAAGQGRKVERLEECDKLRPVLRLQYQPVQIDIERHIGAQFHELARKERLFPVFDDVLAALGLLDFAGAGQQRFEIAVFFQQLRRRLRTDAGDARNIIDRIARQSLQVDHLFRRHAPFLDHIGNADLLVLHAVIHVDVVANELHQVLVGGNDGDVAALFRRHAGIGGDDIVGLEAFGLDAGQVEGHRRLADQTELRDQFFRRRRAVRLVFREKLLAEGFRGIVENDREMGGCDAHRGIARIGDELPQHVAEAGHGADGQAVRFAGERRQRVKRAENEAGAVDEEEMITFFHGRMDNPPRPPASIQTSTANRMIAHRNVTEL